MSMFGQLNVLLSAHFLWFIFVPSCQAMVFFFLLLQSFTVSRFLLKKKRGLELFFRWEAVVLLELNSHFCPFCFIS